MMKLVNEKKCECVSDEKREYVSKDVSEWHVKFKNGEVFNIDKINKEDIIKDKRHTTIKISGRVFPIDFINTINNNKKISKLTQKCIMRELNGEAYEFVEEFTNMKIISIRKSIDYNTLNYGLTTEIVLHK